MNKMTVPIDEQSTQPHESSLVRFHKAAQQNFGLYILDAAAWTLAFVLAALIRLDFYIHEVPWGKLFALIFVACFLQFTLGYLLRHYGRSRYSRVGGIDEALATTLLVGAIGIAVWLTPLIVTSSLNIGASIIVMGTLMALVFMFAIRFVVRAAQERALRPGDQSTPTLIYGAGYVGTMMVQWMMSDATSQYRPVGLLDDDPRTHNFRVRGVRVLGSLDALERAVEATGAKVLIVAINEASSPLLRDVQSHATGLGLKVKVVSTIDNVFEEQIKGQDLRDLDIEDLLGRNQVETNVGEIASYLSGKRVLVTGAGGSIGSQLCSEIAKFSPSELMMLDRDETGLQSALINVEGNGLLDTNAVVLADIRDKDTLMRIFHERKPEVVFHAAALKHLPMLEQYPEEAWQTNVLGTLNVLEAARSVDVEAFINISTDKAANPTSVLGYSKRYAEKLTAWMGDDTGRKYLSVRFGNVIGSRGSMVPTFVRLIAEDKPVTVTDPQATRYFMTIPEACQLVLQAGGIGAPGEVLILDMGEPVNILSIAKQMIEISGKDIEIVFTGLRPGEKLHEELVAENESADRPFHSLISHTRAEQLAPVDLSLADFNETIEGNTKVSRPHFESSTASQKELTK